MLGASRESLSGVSDRLDERRDAAGFGDLAEQLYSVADLLGREKQLRSTLADAGQPAAARAALAHTLLDGRVSPLSVEVVADVVAQRWSTDADLVTAIERLGDQAAFTVAESDGTLDATEEDLFLFGRVVDGSSDLQMALTDPSLSTDAKAGIVSDLLAGKATPTARLVLEYAVGHLRGQRLDAAIDGLMDLAARQRERVVADVRVARPLDPEQERRLSDALSRLKGRTVRLNVAVDPDVLGGVYVKVGDEVIDGTVAARMEQARRAVLD
jgi:F-type H+-transporting ATPase subunit delta